MFDIIARVRAHNLFKVMMKKMNMMVLLSDEQQRNKQG